MKIEKKFSSIIILTTFLILSNNFVFGNVKIEKAYYDYVGKKGNNDIIMSIYINNSKILGAYSFKGIRKSIKLEGQINNGKITLKELSENNKVIGTFSGSYKSIDKIEGIWTNTKDKLPFKLNISNIIYADYGKRYSIIGFSDKEVIKFASNIQESLIKDNKKVFAKFIAYPIDVKINGKKIKIKNEEDFIKNYDKIFNTNLKKAIISTNPLFMFVNQYGVRLGENGYNVWFTGIQKKSKKCYLLIYAINN